MAGELQGTDRSQAGRAHTFATQTDADRWLTTAELDISRGTWMGRDEGRIHFGDYAAQ